MLTADSAIVDSKDEDDMTALFLAAEQRNLGVVKVLLKRSSDSSAQSIRYGNTLHAASDRGHKDIATLLLDKGASRSSL